LFFHLVQNCFGQEWVHFASQLDMLLSEVVRVTREKRGTP